MSCKVITAANGDLLYQQSILIPKNTQILLERFHTKRKQELGGCTFQSSINAIISDYLKFWNEIENGK